MEHIYDMIVIGGGPAGYTTALYAARAGFDTLVIEKMGAGGQMALTDVIDNYPGFDEGIDGFTLGMKMQAGAARFGAKTKFAEVIDCQLEGHIKQIITAKATFLTRTVVIATGATPRALGIENEESLIGRGLHYCAHCDGRFYQDKTVIVVGGGNSAAADALYLSNLAKKVYLVHRRDSLRATKVYHEPLMRAENVEFIWNSVVSNFIVEERLTGIHVKNVIDGTTSEIKADGLFVSIGRDPASALFAKQIHVDDHQYIIADESTRTNIDGVYAVGDVRTKVLRQVVTAVSDGAVAVHYAEEYLAN